jgi:hypothetical protein
MPFFPNSSKLSKNNARNIRHMAVLIFRKFLDFEQVSEVRDSEMPILRQAPGYCAGLDLTDASGGSGVPVHSGFFARERT